MLVDKKLIYGLIDILKNVYSNEKWITIKPHGDDSDDYRRLKLEDGETPKEAIDRVYKSDSKEPPKSKIKKSDAKTIEEAIKNLKTYAKEVKFSKNINLDVANRINDILTDLSNKYGNLNYESIEPSRSQSSWAAANENHLFLTKFFESLNKDEREKTYRDKVKNYKENKEWQISIYKKDIEKNRFVKIAKKELKRLNEEIKYVRNQVFYSPNSLEKDILTHEVGHTLMMRKMQKEQKNNSFETYQKISDAYLKAKNNGDIYKISRYAGTDAHEFFAEAFVIYNNKVDKLPDYIENVIREVIE